MEAKTLFHHILVPTDGSQPSVAAGRLAIQLAVLHQAQITFIYVVDDAVVEELAGASGRMAQQVRQDLEVTGQRYLSYLARLAADVSLTANQAIRYGTPYSEIESLAREQGVDLIVIGQVGRRGPRRILIGSVTERVIEHAPCPVLVVK
ncbi:MAG: universal stress protein [Anaerolineae bacterium]|jgi:nucleotide-binding universal stress UspA family protein|nr:universal stress protein [Anaerolineae bacterium]MDH7474850.1 universal stress protein [Anaerolineae bacterium]